METTDKEGRTELFYVACKDDTHRIRALVDAGANINARNNHGETPLHYAVRAFALDAVSVLMAMGAEIDAQDVNGNTPLSYAVYDCRGHGEMIRLLLAAGADKHLPNRYGVSPEKFAASAPNSVAAHLLIDNQRPARRLG